MQLFNSWRNSKALENSPESFLGLPASVSVWGWMRECTALSSSFSQKQRCSWAMGSAGSLWEVYTPSLLSDFTDQSQLRKNCLPNGVKSQCRQSGMGLESDWLATPSAQLNR